MTKIGLIIPSTTKGLNCKTYKDSPLFKIFLRSFYKTYNNDLEYTLEHMNELVIKPASECGGYGLLIGPKATKKEIDEFKKVLISNPRNYISQPTMQFSRAPVLSNKNFEGRHIDLRPFILYSGNNCHVLPGGLTRVALKKGSLVVNSSQGGGIKDTWITDTTFKGI